MSDTPYVQDMKDAMRRLAASVVVITARQGTQRFAMSATSVQSLSLAPPSLVACVNRSASIHDSLSEGADFCVNVLSAGHIPLAQACSGRLPLEERFSVGDWRETEAGLPYLADAQANVICAMDQRLEYGTHSIIVGRVREVLLSASIQPLVYVDGGYIGLTVQAQAG